MDTERRTAGACDDGDSKEVDRPRSRAERVALNGICDSREVGNFCFGLAADVVCRDTGAKETQAACRAVQAGLKSKEMELRYGKYTVADRSVFQTPEEIVRQESNRKAARRRELLAELEALEDDHGPASVQVAPPKG